MNGVSPIEPARVESHNTPKLAQACRFAFVCVLLVASSQNLTTCLRIRNAGRLFEDMLGAGSMLPTVTIWVLTLEPFLKVVAFIIPLIALTLFMIRNVTVAIYTAGALFFLSAVMQTAVNYAIWEPVFEIMRRMQGGAP